MKAFFDVNVLLEVLLAGRKKQHIAETALFRAHEAYISPLSAHIYVRFGQKEQHDTNQLLKDLESFNVIPMDEDTVHWATLNRRDDDFEDALQVGCAIINGCENFYTFNKKLAKRYDNLPTLKVHLLN